MKKNIIFIIPLLLVLFSCSNEQETNLEVSDPEAFAFKLDEGWELNASAQVKGFKQEETDNEFTTKLSYYADLITPSGETLSEVDNGIIDKSEPEEMTDLQVNIQISLDGSFKLGEYQIVIHVIDDLSGNEDTAKTKFVLTDK